MMVVETPNQTAAQLTGSPASWAGAHFVSVLQLDRSAVDLFLRIAGEMRELVAKKGE
jgi:hypothetical protein